MANLQNIAEQLSSLTVIEAAELSRLLEQKWGVSAAAPVSVAPVIETVQPEVEAQTEFTVTLMPVDASKKIGVIKDIRAITNLGLKEAKQFVESAPKVIKEAVSMTEANAMKDMLEKSGAVVEIK